MTGSERYRQRRYKHLPDRAVRAMSEAAWQAQVEELATRYGWRFMHAHPSRAGVRVMTALRGPLARGWPDLVLARAGRTIGAELKRHGGHPTPDQLAVLSWLASAGWETYIWWPSDLDLVVQILSRG